MTLTTPERLALDRLRQRLWAAIDRHSHFDGRYPVRSDDVRDAEELLSIIDKVIAAATKP